MVSKLQIFIALILAGAAGAAGYEANESSKLNEQRTALQQQQMTLAREIQELERQREDATNQMAALLEQNRQLAATQNGDALTRLQSEVDQLEADRTNQEMVAPEVDAWLDRVYQLQKYVAEHPEQCIPEFAYLTDREWLLIADLPLTNSDGESENAMEDLKSQAEGRFAEAVGEILKRYTKDSNNRAPDDFSQLEPYGDGKIVDILKQRYEIKPMNILPASAYRPSDLVVNWLIAGKQTVQSGTADHIAIFPGGYTYYW